MSDASAPTQLHPVKQALVIIGGYLASETVLVACAILWVFLYSTLIYRDGDNAYYASYAQLSSPVVAVVLAGPVFFALGRFLRRRFRDQALRLAMVTAVVGIVIDLPLVMVGDVDSPVYSLTTIVLSVLASLIGAYRGARLEPVESMGATA